jgi:hypothetical protein
MLFPPGRLYEEIAYIAYHLHWSYSEIIQMDHQERQHWVEEVASINKRLIEFAGESV